MGRFSDALEKEKKIYDFITHNGPASFYEIQKALEYSSGAIQAAVKRCISEKADYRLFESTRVSPMNHRLTRVFQTTNIEETLDIEQIFEEHEKISRGEILDKDTNVIIPFELDKSTMDVLQEIINVTEIDNIGGLFKEALMSYLQREVSPATIKQVQINLQGGA